MSGPVTGTQAVPFSPVGSPRTYFLAPLDWRERIAYRGDLTREAGHYPSNASVLAALRAAVQASGAANADALIAAIDLAEAEPENSVAQVELNAVQAGCAAVPAVAALIAQRQQHVEMIPWVAARHCLRGWEGPELPAFQRERDRVAFELLAQLDPAELSALGYEANRLTQMDRRAEGNSASP